MAADLQLCFTEQIHTWIKGIHRESQNIPLANSFKHKISCVPHYEFKKLNLNISIQLSPPSPSYNKRKKAAQHSEKFYRNKTQGHSSSGAQGGVIDHWDSWLRRRDHCPSCSASVCSPVSNLVPIYLIISTASQVQRGQILDSLLFLLPLPTL